MNPITDRRGFDAQDPTPESLISEG